MAQTTFTPFNKEQFTTGGGYLTYRGHQTINEDNWTFIARFKYGHKPYKKWINFLCKNFFVEEYIQASKETSPREAMESKGYWDETTVRCLQAKVKCQQLIIDELNKKLEAVK